MLVSDTQVSVGIY